VFGQNDLVKVLEGKGNQSDFMEYVRYCDSEIAKTVNGASLGSNVSKRGSYAQSKSHEENRTEIVNSDSKYATRIATKL
ncbi:phage portal protein family protein, partial [Aliarcobacter butzleri]